MKDHLVSAENFTARQKDFLKANPHAWLMIRPDRHLDQAAHRYPDDDARRKGNAAMKAWFEYLAAKKFIENFNAWCSILKSGKSIMVVCADPFAFDVGFAPPSSHVLWGDFWDEFEQSRVPVDHRYDDPGVRERCLAIVKDCAAGLRMRMASPPPDVRPLRELKSTPLDKIDATKPPAVSPELRAKLGIRNEAVQA